MVKERSVPGGAITLTAENYKSTILNGRMLELAWEGGNRWIDMKRTNLAKDHVIANGQQECKINIPIPLGEVDANAALSQNSCY